MKDNKVKKYINYIITAFLFITLLFFFVWSFQLSKNYNQVQLYAHNKYDINAVLSMEQQYQEENNITFWKQLDDEEIKNADLERIAKADVIALRGDSKLVVNEGIPLEAIDGESCILGKNVAYDLYGSVDVVGLNASYNGREYEIVDVLEKNQDVFIYEVQPLDVTSFDRISSLRKNGETSLTCKNRLEIQYGIEGEIIDYEFELFVIRFITMIFLLGILIYGVIKIKVYILNKKEVSENVKGVIDIACVVACIVITIVCLGRLNVPLDYIPTGWSEYTFWGEFFETKIKNIRNIMLMKKSVPDCDIYFSVIKYFSLLFGVLIIYALRSRVKRK